MILSHSRQFIFIKTRKVSGTSMEISLSQACGADDVITPISYEDELVRLDLGGCLPQNYGDPNEEAFRELIRTRNPDVDKVKHKGRFFNHVPAVKVRRYVGQDVWDRYFTFSMERHPYEKVMSLLYYHMRGREGWNFERELKRVIRKKNYVNYPVYSDGETPIVDFIVNYEKLQQDLQLLSDKLGFDVTAHYPKTKHQYRSDRRPAQELLNDEQKEMIFRNCRVEFETLGFDR
jgi:hypothetical protein